MAVQCARRSRLAGDLCRDAAYAGGVEGADQQDRPQRCAWYGTDDAGWSVPSGACEDAAQSETADATDPSQAAAVEGDRHDNDLRGTLRNFGLKVGMAGKARFEARI